MRFASILALLALAVGAPAVQAQGPAAPLSPGDRVFVRAGSDTVWSDSLPVDAEGRIFLPRVGALDLRAVPATAVPRAVRNALAGIYRSVDATVVPLRRVTVAGEAKRPGVYYLPLEATLRDAVAVAQGVTDIGNAERLTLVRGDAETLFRHWMTRAEGAQYAASGDVLIIGRDSWIKRNALATLSTLGLLVTAIVAVTR